jgi:hypothetical protein
VSVRRPSARAYELYLEESRAAYTTLLTFGDAVETKVANAFFWCGATLALLVAVMAGRPFHGGQLALTLVAVASYVAATAAALAVTWGNDWEAAGDPMDVWQRALSSDDDELVGAVGSTYRDMFDRAYEDAGPRLKRGPYWRARFCVRIAVVTLAVETTTLVTGLLLRVVR